MAEGDAAGGCRNDLPPFRVSAGAKYNVSMDVSGGRSGAVSGLTVIRFG